MRSNASPLHRARRNALTLAAAVVSVCALSIGTAVAQAPKSPVTINVVDVAGNLALTQDAFELYAKKFPNMVAKFNFTIDADGPAGNDHFSHSATAA